jgi:hypothetical protein
MRNGYVVLACPIGEALWLEYLRRDPGDGGWPEADRQGQPNDERDLEVAG